MTSTVIVLNCNGRHFLPDCLNSLEGNCPEGCEVLVVDNGSADGSLELLSSRYPWVRVLPMGSNVGFAAGNNAGVRASDSDVVVFLNNDTRVAPDWAAKLLEPFGDPDVGAVTSSMRRFGETGIMDSAGGAIDHLFFSSDRGRGEPAERWSEPDEILFPCGGAMAVRRIALEEPDRAFWDDLFIYSEDLDLGLSLNRRGWRVVYQPEAVVEHYFSGTTSSNSPLKELRCNRNRILVIRRHLSPRAKRRLFPVLAAWQAAWLLLMLLKGQFARFRAVAAGTAQGLRMRVLPLDHQGDLESGEAVMLRFMIPREGSGPGNMFAGMAARSLAGTVRRRRG